MKNDGKSDSTINFTRKALNYLDNHANLKQPEAVKAYIAQLRSGNGYKHNLALAYDKYCQYHKIKWIPPRLQKTSKSSKNPNQSTN